MSGDRRAHVSHFDNEGLRFLRLCQHYERNICTSRGGMGQHSPRDPLANNPVEWLSRARGHNLGLPGYACRRLVPPELAPQPLTRAVNNLASVADEEGKLGPLPQLYLRYAFANGDSVNTCVRISTTESVPG